MLIPHSRLCASSRGFTLIEVLIAVLVLVCALTAFLRSLVGSSELGHANREASIASEGARAVIEGFYAVDFAQLYALYNATDADDPVADAPGSAFDVAGLKPRDGDPDGRVGEVRFPTVDVGGGVLELREDLVDAELGMPRDLDADTVVDGADHSADYRMLPVEVTVAWEGRSGPKELTLRTIVAAR